jgi:hypothetical protein
MLRYSLLGLLIAVAMAGTFFAALAKPSALWMQTTATLTLTMLLAAAIMAIFTRGQLRAFSCGAVVVGMTMRFFVLPQESFAMEPSKLLSSTVLTWSFEKLHGGEGAVDSGIGVFALYCATRGRNPDQPAIRVRMPEARLARSTTE